MRLTATVANTGTGVGLGTILAAPFYIIYSAVAAVTFVAVYAITYPIGYWLAKRRQSRPRVTRVL